MNTILERTAALLRRRFILSAFLPVLILGTAAFIIYVVATGAYAALLDTYSRQSGPVQVLLAAGWLATAWFVAGVLSSQLRNLTQIFEGYPLQRHPALRPIAEYAALQHYSRMGRLVKRKAESAVLLYPQKYEHFMPTALGNALRAGEFYPHDRYEMNALFAWPRLMRLAPDHYRRDIEEFRADYESLLALACLLSVLATALGVGLYLAAAPWWLFLSCFGGGWVLAYIAYRSAVPAAVEFGEQVRAGVDLYRTELLIALRLGVPDSNATEREMWRKIDIFHRKNADAPYTYSSYRPLPPDEPPTET